METGRASSPLVPQSRKEDLMRLVLMALVFLVSLAGAEECYAFGERVTVQYQGANLDAGSSSCGRMVDWNGDGLQDIIAAAEFDPSVRFYPNSGSPGSPVFNTLYFVQADGDTLDVPSGL
jgi:hypothetical protein